MEKNGLVIVHTGNGKGKTTAALGLAVRAVGNGEKVYILQFIKGGWKYGELNTLARLAPDVVIEQAGKGFTRRDESAENQELHKQAAAEAIAKAREAMLSGKWQLIILDELNYAVKFGLVTVEAVVDLIKAKPQDLHLVITGRDAVPQIIELADLVTEMKEIKHPYHQGIKAQAGIEF